MASSCSKCVVNYTSGRAPPVRSTRYAIPTASGTEGWLPVSLTSASTRRSAGSVGCATRASRAAAHFSCSSSISATFTEATLTPSPAPTAETDLSSALPESLSSSSAGADSKSDSSPRPRLFPPLSSVASQPQLPPPLPAFLSAQAAFCSALQGDASLPSSEGGSHPPLSHPPWGLLSEARLEA